MSVEALGELGEKIVYEYYKSLGSQIEMSVDPFDMQKDMVIDGKKTEVKFQTPYFRFSPPGYEPYKAFTVPVTGGKNKQVRSNQLDKCLNADRWIIVENPSKGSNIVRLWEAPPLGKRRFRLVRNSKDDRIAAGFAMSDFSLIIDIDNKKMCDIIRRSNKSHWNYV